MAFQEDISKQMIALVQVLTVAFVMAMGARGRVEISSLIAYGATVLSLGYVVQSLQRHFVLFARSIPQRLWKSMPRLAILFVVIGWFGVFGIFDPRVVPLRSMWLTAIPIFCYAFPLGILGGSTFNKRRVREPYRGPDEPKRIFIFLLLPLCVIVGWHQVEIVSLSHLLPWMWAIFVALIGSVVGLYLRPVFMRLGLFTRRLYDKVVMLLGARPIFNPKIPFSVFKKRHFPWERQGLYAILVLTILIVMAVVAGEIWI